MLNEENRKMLIEKKVTTTTKKKNFKKIQKRIIFLLILFFFIIRLLSFCYKIILILAVLILILDILRHAFKAFTITSEKNEDIDIINLISEIYLESKEKEVYEQIKEMGLIIDNVTNPSKIEVHIKIVSNYISGKLLEIKKYDNDDLVLLEFIFECEKYNNRETRCFAIIEKNDLSKINQIKQIN